jgi:hypothetical protein
MQNSAVIARIRDRLTSAITRRQQIIENSTQRDSSLFEHVERKMIDQHKIELVEEITNVLQRADSVSERVRERERDEARARRREREQERERTTRDRETRDARDDRDEINEMNVNEKNQKNEMI